MKVGYIGLGNMGKPMARNILRAGHDLKVFNRTTAKLTDIVAEGAQATSSPREAAQHREVVCVCVSRPSDLHEVVLGDQGILRGAAKGTVIVDFSTVDPETSRHVAGECASRDVAFLDAPVSGGVTGAQSGTLTVIVGGINQAFSRAQPVFEAVGQNVRLVGPSGAGSTMKLINQVLVGVNLAAVLEAFNTAEVAGIDRQALFEVLSTSAGRSFMLEYAIPDRVFNQNFEPGFALNLLCKDVDLAVAMGNQLQSPMVMPAIASDLFHKAIAAGYGGRDMTATSLLLQAQRPTSDEA